MRYKVYSEKDFEYFYAWISKDERGIEPIRQSMYPRQYPCLVSYNYQYNGNGWDYYDFDFIYQDKNGEWDLKIVES